jgi:hypothetical protein
MVENYLRELRQALGSLPPAVANDVASQVSEHIDAALSAISNPSESDVKHVLAEVGSPLTIARAAAEEFPSTHWVSLRTLSFWGYTFWFAALWGFSPRDVGTDPWLVLIGCAMALFGQGLLLLRTTRVKDRHLRSRVYRNDLAVVMAALAIDLFLPVSVRVLKGPVMMVLFLTYYSRTRHLWEIG